MVKKIKINAEDNVFYLISTCTVASISDVSVFALAFKVTSGVYTGGIRVTVMATIIALIKI